MTIVRADRETVVIGICSAAIIKTHSPGSSNNRNVSSHSAGEAEIRVWARAVFSEASLLGM